MQNFSILELVSAFLGHFFSQFFVIFSCKNSVFCEGGWPFWVKKKLFFHAKYQILRGWVLFLVPFFVIFLSFFLNVLPNSGGPASAAVRVLTAVNAGSLCTLAGGWRSHDNSSLFQSSHASARSARARTSRVAKAVLEKPAHRSRWEPQPLLLFAADLLPN